MTLTHLTFYSFLAGASGVAAGAGVGGSSALPPFYLFDGFTGSDAAAFTGNYMLWSRRRGRR